MWKQLVESFKVEIKLKDVAIWFVLSFIGVLLVFGVIGNKPFNLELVLTTFGFALVFVALMAMTKSYGRFLEIYYGNIKGTGNTAKSAKSTNKKSSKKKK